MPSRQDPELDEIERLGRCAGITEFLPNLRKLPAIVWERDHYNDPEVQHMFRFTLRMLMV